MKVMFVRSIVITYEEILMTFKYLIGISGWAGTGTSTAAQGVRERLGDTWEIRRPGSDTFRRMAKEAYPDLGLGSALAHFAQDATFRLSIDLTCDAALCLAIEKSRNTIFDARLAGRFLPPEALKVLLVCDDAIRFARIAKREGKDLALATAENLAREEADALRYLRIYGTTVELQAKFDLIIDTGECDEQEVVDQIITKFYKLALASN